MEVTRPGLNSFYEVDFKNWITAYQTTNGNTIPETMTVTQLKPNIVIFNERDKIVEIF